jgi:hypothetical protein
MELEFSGQIFEKYKNTKFNENPPSCTRIVPCGQTDGHNKASSSFSQFRARTKKKVNLRLEA